MSLFSIIAKIGADATEFNATLKKMEGDTSKSFKAIAGFVGSAFSVGAITAFAASAVKASADFADLADQVGATTDEIQALNKVADHSGMPLEKYITLLTKIRKLKADAASGDSGAIAAFKRAGIDSNGTPLEIMQRLGQVSDERAFGIMGAKDARLKNSLGEVAPLNALERVGDPQARVNDAVLDVIGDFKRAGIAFTANMMAQNMSPLLGAYGVAKGFIAADQGMADGRALAVPSKEEDDEYRGEVFARLRKQRYKEEDDAKKAMEDGEKKLRKQDIDRMSDTMKLSTIPGGDRANVGMFTGPNAGLNSKMAEMNRSMSSMLDHLKSLDAKVPDITKEPV